MVTKVPELLLPDPASLETREVWQALAAAHRHLAELKGLCESLPDSALLIDSFGADGALETLLAVASVNVVLVVALFIVLKRHEARRPG